MKIALGILISLIIGYSRVRLIDRAFSHKKIKFRLSIRTSIHGLLLVGLLFLYQYFLNSLGRNNQYFLNNFSAGSILLFIVYCVLIILGLAYIYQNLKKKKFIETFIIGSIGFLIVGVGGYFLGISVVLMYFIISAYAEEYLKFGTGKNILLGEKDPLSTDLILFSIMIGLGFSGIENIFYVGQNIREALQNNTEISSSILTTGRGLISTLIHVVSTGLIAYTILFFEKKQNSKIKMEQGQNKFNFFPIFLGLLLGAGLHTLFNLSLHFSRKFILIPLVILCYFLLTFLLFKSDRIYLQKNKEKKSEKKEL